MSDTTDAIVVLVTAPPDRASELARGIVEARLAACVAISAPIRSIYRWQGAIQDDQESQLVIKTTRAHFARLEAHVRANHPYDVPEILALPVVAGSAPYLAWLRTETQID